MKCTWRRLRTLTGKTNKNTYFLEYIYGKVFSFSVRWEEKRDERSRKMKKDRDDRENWNAEWLTIPQFADIRPINLLHKEQECAVCARQSDTEQESARQAWQNLHVLVRAHFSAKKKQEKLYLNITADDRYKLYLDGGFAAEGPAPGYPQHYYYNRILLEQVELGEHVLGIHLYYQGLVNRVYYSGDRRFAFAAQLWDESGEEVPLSFCCRRTDAYQGETTGYETQFLENFDSRKFPERWREPDFPEEGWEAPVPAAWADYRLYPQPTKLLFYEQRKPQEIAVREDGSIFIDAGEELTGSICLAAEGHAGDTVEIFCGEELDAQGNVRYELRCGCTYREVWTLADGVCRLEPYDYKGFRYAGIVPSAGAAVREISLAVRHYPMDPGACTFTCTDEALVRIFDICKNAVRLGTQESYIDCPTREKGQYLGDAIVTAHAQVLLTGKTDMLRKCIDEFAQTAQVCPGLLAVAPGGLMQEIADFSLLYGQLLLLYYRFTGDRETVAEYFDTARGIVTHFARYERADGLLEQVSDKWNLVDWPENLRDGYEFALTRPIVAPGCHNVINALYLGAKKTLNELAAILGRREEYALVPSLKAYQKAFYREDTGLLADSETSGHSALHANVYALYFGLLPEEKEGKLVSLLVEKGFSCGVWVSYFVLLALAKKERYHEMYELLTNDGAHGWKHMLREGATACFEAWGKDQKWNTSLCHPWAGAPIPVIIEYLCGLYADPDAPDGIRFAPHIPEEIEELVLRVTCRGNVFLLEKKGADICLTQTGVI